MKVKVEVYQMLADLNGKECSFNRIGTVSAKDGEIHPDTIWHLTNHSCWNFTRDKNGDLVERKTIKADGCKYNPTVWDRGYTNDDICFEINGVWWCAKSAGWEKLDSKEDAKRYLFEHATWVRFRLGADADYDKIKENF
jgi:hypothetical protein